MIFQTEKAGETPEKEQIELTEEGAEEKDDSTETEKTKKKKEKKEKKKKEPKPPKEKKPKGPSCVETLSAGLDLTNRDGKSINTDVCVSSICFVRLNFLLYTVFINMLLLLHKPNFSLFISSWTLMTYLPSPQVPMESIQFGRSHLFYFLKPNYGSTGFLQRCLQYPPLLCGLLYSLS